MSDKSRNDSDGAVRPDLRAPLALVCVAGTGHAERLSIAQSILRRQGAELLDEQYLREALLLVYLMACLLALPGNVELVRIAFYSECTMPWSEDRVEVEMGANVKRSGGDRFTGI